MSRAARIDSKRVTSPFISTVRHLLRNAAWRQGRSQWTVALSSDADKLEFYTLI